jgi:hypothetical protein
MPRRSRKNSRRRGNRSFNYSRVLVGAVLLLILAGFAWYWIPVWEAQKKEKKVQELASRHPNAEVFEIGPDSEKKK